MMNVPNKGIVIKTTGAIHMTASRTLTLNERQISSVLLKNAYKNLPNEESHSISIIDLASSLGWDSKKNYNKIKSAIKKLVDTTLEFNCFGKDKSSDWMICSLLSGAKFKNGICTYSYFLGLRNLLYEPKIYARLNLLVSSKFKSKYSIALWEFLMECICSSKESNCYTNWISIDEYLKKILCVERLKADFKDINRRNIGLPVKEINEISEINTSPEFKKENKKVTHVRFLIEKKNSFQESNAKDFPLPTNKEDENDVYIREFAKMNAKSNPDGYAYRIKEKIKSGESSIDSIKKAVDECKEKERIEKNKIQKEEELKKEEEEKRKTKIKEHEAQIEKLNGIEKEKYDALESQVVKKLTNSNSYFGASYDKDKNSTFVLKMIESEMINQAIKEYLI